ncbi:hypothetical protein WJ0W_003541 [Paenibacillus melissococcoides]|uniref:Uncharacterized protein n=1 Tax=Paenibacillus melissococcoides TaxID=2912268 RepID=A0ABM9G3S5_9BACL|nr:MULTISPECIES: hypothetical protein [Paenibacillus]GIO82254.1 hypothetical protein J6TS7_58640 [Paenibacillus dendritiformis]CAH8246306.1 hypothetical protein WJ0W_003541 [Paenibacillus melissococcoides]CAH8713574.1 hypothetical protein WDD9_003613 [Paenibacillus melissococcoides]CAH8714307.1 hypothetical protein HTL2_003916 [Paenibacillus melissococcoides]
MSKRSVGKKTVVSLLGVIVAILVSHSEYWVNLKDSIVDQWQKAAVRMDKLLTVGHRKRGDVGVLV